MNSQSTPSFVSTGGNPSNQPSQTSQSAKSAGGKTAPAQDKPINNNQKKEDDKKKKEDEKNKKIEEEKRRKEDAKNQKKQEEKHKEEEEKRKKEDAKNQKKEDEKRKKEDAENQKKEDEKRRKEEQKHKEEDAKNQKKEDEKHKKEEAKKKKENEKNQKKEDDKRKQEDAKNRKKEDEKRKKEEEKHKQQDAKNRKKEDDKRKQDDANNRKKEEEMHRKEDAINRNKEAEKYKNEDKKENKGDEKKRKKAEEKQKKKAEKEKNKKVSRGCCSCRAGVCKCWYCCWCHCLLPPFIWIFGVLLLGLSLYYALRYTLEVEEDQQENNLLFLYWGTFTYAFLFVILVQMTYLLVLFESTNKCGIALYAILFAIAFILCFVVLIFSIYCPGWCPRGKPQNGTVINDYRWIERISEQVYHILLAAAITLALFIFLLHIYLYNTLQFLEEKDLRENKEAYCHGGKPPDDASRSQKSTAISYVSTQQSFGRITKYHTESALHRTSSFNNNNSFASIARRYRSISYERSTPTKYTGSTYMGMNMNTQLSTRRESYDSTC